MWKETIMSGDLKQGKKQVPVREGLFTMPKSPAEKPSLLGSKCSACGEAFFPRRTRCANCGAEHLEEIILSRRGKLYNYTIVHNATPGYSGPVPYGIGRIELPEGIAVTAPLTGCDLNTLKIGMQLELVLEKQYDDENGNEVIAYKFKSV
jgi:uncharacterized OB-fold protein